MICVPCKEAVDAGVLGESAHKEAGCKALMYVDPMMCDCQHREPSETYIQEATLKRMREPVTPQLDIGH